MKNWMLRASALAFAAGLTGAWACGSSSGCGGTNINANTPSTLGMTCGQGTYLSNNQCVPIPTKNGNTNTSSTPVQTN